MRSFDRMIRSVAHEVRMSVKFTRLVKTCLGIASAYALAGCAMLSAPVTKTQVAGFTAGLVDQLAEVPDPHVGELSVDDAVSRALRFNQSIRAKELEAALAEAKVSAQSGSMLPSLVAESDYYRRNRPARSRSNLSDVYSSSSDLKNISRDISLSWNVLDFGLSLVRSRQSLDKARQQQEDVRRIRARIVEDTRSVYWRAVAAERIGPAIARLDREVDDALRLSRQASDALQIDPMAQVSFQRDVLNLQRDLNQLDAALAGSVNELKLSIGHPIHEPLLLKRFVKHAAQPKLTSYSDADTRAALSQRPEIRQHMYDLRIGEDEVTAAILQVLPGISFTRMFTSDSNSFLYHSNWLSWGVRIAGNLMNLVRLPGDLDAIEAQQMVHRQNALATAATIVLQVHVSRARLQIQHRAYRDAVRFAEAQQSLLQQARAAVRTGKAGQQSLAREKLSAVQAEVRVVLAYADLHAAMAAYASARGDEPSAAAEHSNTIRTSSVE
jgi:outer membrane protein TolC